MKPKTLTYVLVSAIIIAIVGFGLAFYKMQADFKKAQTSYSSPKDGELYFYERTFGEKVGDEFVWYNISVSSAIEVKNADTVLASRDYVITKINNTAWMIMVDCITKKLPLEQSIPKLLREDEYLKKQGVTFHEVFCNVSRQTITEGATHAKN